VITNETISIIAYYLLIRDPSDSTLVVIVGFATKMDICYIRFLFLRRRFCIFYLFFYLLVLLCYYIICYMYLLKYSACASVLSSTESVFEG
jgi:hypothetical protein